MRILVADDDRLLSHLVCAVVAKRGWEAVPAFDVPQVLTAAAAGEPAFDAVVLDLHMPGGDGLDTLRALATSPATASAPVVVLSGTLDPDASRTVAELGAVAFLAKPFRPADLLEVLDRAVG